MPTVSALQMNRQKADAALGRLIERLGEVCPELERSEIERMVCDNYADFDASTVRDFVPILVERRARALLDRCAEPHLS